MPSFLKDIEEFYGTGEVNAAGQTLDEFLEAYDPYRYKTPSCTTDAVIFSYEGESVSEIGQLKLLLIKRSNHPSIGWWALPGGFIELEENLEDTARRELEEETGVSGLLMEQIGAYGDYDRDPRARVITTAYMSLVKQSEVQVQAGDDAADAAWCQLNLQEINRKREETVTVNTYKLTLLNEKEGISFAPVVEERVSDGIIRERKFTVKEKNGIASDHAAMIVHALCLLKERFE